MTDHFEQVKSEILRRTAENGGPTPGDLLDALEATNEDFDNGLGAVTLLLSEHVKEDKARAKAQADMCAATHRKLINEEFTHQHATDEADDATTRAVLVTEVAEAAAQKTLALAAEKARGVVSTAQGAAGEVIHTAEERAAILADAGEEGDIKRAWRVAKWFVLAVAIVVVNQLGNVWFGR